MHRHIDLTYVQGAGWAACCNLSFIAGIGGTPEQATQALLANIAAREARQPLPWGALRQRAHRASLASPGRPAMSWEGPCYGWHVWDTEKLGTGLTLAVAIRNYLHAKS